MKALTLRGMIGIGVAGVILTIGSWWYSRTSTQTHTNPTPRVTIAEVVEKDTPLTIKLPSSLQAEQTVTIKPRVDGFIKQVHFKEGELVKADQLLFTLDDNELQAQLQEAQANLDKTQALYTRAEMEVQRLAPLLQQGFVAQARYDDTVAQALSLKAQKKALEANVKLLKVKLSYTKITSPLTAIAGFVKVDAGNYIRTSDNIALVSLAQIDPLEAVVEVPEKFLPHLTASNLESHQVIFSDANGTPLDYKPWVDALDNAVNPASGTIALKIKVHNTLVNERPQLFPGQYVDVTIQLVTFQDSLIVPLTAIQTGQKGSYVFTYDPQTKTVRQQIVELSHTTPTEAVIMQGLTKGQQVVTSGHIRLKDGLTVAVIS